MLRVFLKYDKPTYSFPVLNHSYLCGDRVKLIFSDLYKDLPNYFFMLQKITGDETK